MTDEEIKEAKRLVAAWLKPSPVDVGPELDEVRMARLLQSAITEIEQLRDACKMFLEKWYRQGMDENMQLEKFDTVAMAMEKALDQEPLSITTIDGFSEDKEADNYWQRAVNEFWDTNQMGLDTDEIELRLIVKWFDEYRKKHPR